MAEKLTYERIIIGIDPGTSITGYGVIGCNGNKIFMINCGVINMTKIKGDHPRKLKKIFERTLGLIEEYHPDEMAIEAPFYGKNVQSMLKLGRAQGVAMAAALYREVPITEYAPKKIKMAITGSGKSSKEQVAKMLETLLNYENTDLPLDATDGLAAAVCHSFQHKSLGKSGHSGWKAFLKDNPGRVK